MGGDYQPMGHMTVAVNRYIYGMDPQECLDWPRYFPKAGEVRAETGVAPSALAGLVASGHRVVAAPKPLGGGQAIAIDRSNRPADRRLRPAQGRAGAGLLSVPVFCLSLTMPR